MSATAESTELKREAGDNVGLGEPHAKKTKGRARNYASSNIVTVIVSPEVKIYHVHEHILQSESRNFDAIRSQDDFGRPVLRLPDARVDAFESILEYLYENDFSTSVPSTKPESLDDLVHAWLLADKLQMEGGKNAIMDLIQTTVKEAIKGNWNDKDLVRSSVRTIQNEGRAHSKSSKLHQFFVDRFARDLFYVAGIMATANPCKMSEEVEILFGQGGDIMIDVMTRYFFLRSQACTNTYDPAYDQSCKYHEHRDGEAGLRCPRAQGTGPTPAKSCLVSYPTSPEFAKKTIAESFDFIKQQSGGFNSDTSTSLRVDSSKLTNSTYSSYAFCMDTSGFEPGDSWCEKEPNGTTNVYHHISSEKQPYSHSSPEELRLADYECHRKYAATQVSLSNSGFVFGFGNPSTSNGGLFGQSSSSIGRAFGTSSGFKFGEGLSGFKPSSEGGLFGSSSAIKRLGGGQDTPSTGELSSSSNGSLGLGDLRSSLFGPTKK